MMSQLRWPLHPLPFNEECLLSWLARIGNCYDFTVDELLQHDLGFYGNIDDLNIKAPPWLLTLLSNRTGIDEQVIYAMTLSAWTPLLLDNIFEKDSDFEAYVQSYSLLLPLNKRKKYKPKLPWKPWLSQPLIFSKACPICMDSKQMGAISLAWFLPLMLSCPIHQCQLLQCHIYQGNRIVWAKENELLISITPAISRMDQRTWSALTTGQVILPRRTVHSGVWLRLLRTLLDELHIPVSPIKSLYSKNIVNLWTSLGLATRGGQTRWRPYEFLPMQIQQQTLMAAATIIEQIENELITTPGRQAFLFLPELRNNNDLPSYPEKRKKLLINPESSFQKALDSFNQFVEIAKKNPLVAKNFRNSVLCGRVDFESIQKTNNSLIKIGIPPEFLVT
ncbi:TniQ family protein [Legionella pneumophila]|uniref:TniQ family protein n=1 Tax=Legionella pneumophila TaxID=446 RepID=UPI0026DF30D0|nr:TniQ family protein [Legionella pneumophila]MDO5215760.1 TniQ family protein [Legionella pneumophila]